MSGLPPASVLSRWTVQEVTSWLGQASLTAFRDPFLKECIDGTKLMRLNRHEIDQKYKNVPSKKREILKNHLAHIDNNTSSRTPNLPPRPVGQTRGPAPIPHQPVSVDDSDDEAGWSDEDFEDDDDDDGDYLEPEPRLGGKLNGQNHRPPPPVPLEAPQDTYEIPLEEVQDIVSSREQEGIDEEAPPPPRPPRRTANELPSYCNTDPPPPNYRLPPQPPPTEPIQNALPPEDVYEIMSDQTDSQGPVHQASKPPPPVSGDSVDRPPPRPVKKTSTEQGGFLFNSNQAAATVDELSGQVWYHDKINRQQATTIFEREKKNGMYLIRKSTTNPDQPYTLAIYSDGRIYNIQIRKLSNGNFAPGKMKPGESQFNSVKELVNHFSQVAIVLKPGTDTQSESTQILTTPAPRR